MNKRARRALLRFTILSRVTLGVLLCTLVILSGGALIVLESKELAYTATPQLTAAATTAPFPVGIDLTHETITEQPGVTNYLSNHFAKEPENTKTSFLHSVQKKLLGNEWYQTLASPNSRILVIYAGQRKEEVIHIFGDILHWSDDERAFFEELMLGSQTVLPEGLFFPDTYVVPADASPTFVATQLIARFNENITVRYDDDVRSRIPLQQALTVASLLEREAYTFEDMQIISGVIWNRLFSGMKLQLDATLQYAKASNPSEPYWWPRVLPSDKYIDSPYNTYQHEGLPPAPIANPSAAAVLAALNPIDSDCLFYFHDDDGDLHCSATYAQHVATLRTIYGRGR